MLGEVYILWKECCWNEIHSNGFEFLCDRSHSGLHASLFLFFLCPIKQSSLVSGATLATTWWCTMPIVDKLKEALKSGRKDSADDGELGKLLAASAKKVLLQKIEFEPASRSFSYQLESLKSKYVLLNPKTENSSRHKGCEEGSIRKQGASCVCHVWRILLCSCLG